MSIPGCSSWQCFFCFAFSREWIERVPPENILRVLICLRMLMRDTTFQVHNNYITVNDAHFNPSLSYLHNLTWTDCMLSSAAWPIRGVSWEFSLIAVDYDLVDWLTGTLLHVLIINTCSTLLLETAINNSLQRAGLLT